MKFEIKTKFMQLNLRIDSARVAQYLPFEKVLNGMFEITKLLFGVEFKVYWQ
jgi:Zn-dependent oligopeptidase